MDQNQTGMLSIAPFHPNVDANVDFISILHILIITRALLSTHLSYNTVVIFEGLLIGLNIAE